MYGFGVDMMDQGKLVALAHSIKEDQRQSLAAEFGFYEPKLTTHVRMECILSGYVQDLNVTIAASLIFIDRWWS